MSLPKSIDHSLAIKLINAQAVNRMTTTEQLPLSAANNRVTASVITAPDDIPQYDCSRMDGYVLNLAQLKSRAYGLNNQTQAGFQLPVGEPIHAERQSSVRLCNGQALPIMTGGLIPDDADAIVLKEQASVVDNCLCFDQLPAQNQYIRFAGSDLQKGQVVIQAGTRLNASQLGLLASLGLHQVIVYRQPKVALMVTGDELVQPGETSLPGQTYDANTVFLSQTLLEMGCEVKVLEPLSDQQHEIKRRMQALRSTELDVIVSVGGVSMGDRDWIPSVLAEQGEVLLHKIMVKPGMPMVFGLLGAALYFGLPGNPVSAYSTLCQYVFPVLQALNQQSPDIITWSAQLLHEVKKSHQRREFMRGYFQVSSEGQLQVSVCGAQQSSRIASVAAANCFIVLSEPEQQLFTGDTVLIQPFTQFKV